MDMFLLSLLLLPSFECHFTFFLGVSYFLVCSSGWLVYKYRYHEMINLLVQWLLAIN